jgi:dienelactone hydrolase
MASLKRRLWLLLLIPLALILLFVGGFVVWAQTPYQPVPEAERYLDSSDTVEVVTGGWLIFRPKGINPHTGLIFYPGGRVDPRAYAPAAHDIAASGYLVVIPRMPLNLAVFSPNQADEIIARFPGVEAWAVGGHSLGGAMAAQYAYSHDVDGLVLWASYPASSTNLSGRALKVVSIYGSLDSGANDMRAAESLLPSDTTWVVIEGGNHSQFGWYGLQAGDSAAGISADEQHRITVEATVALLASLNPDER